ncbi:MAG TPA: hypothetical protein VI979_03950 [archaeon]|nr:hypothetical protein [archaeon]
MDNTPYDLPANPLSNDDKPGTYIEFGYDGCSVWGPYESPDIARQVANVSFPMGRNYLLWQKGDGGQIFHIAEYPVERDALAQPARPPARSPDAYDLTPEAMANARRRRVV